MARQPAKSDWVEARALLQRAGREYLIVRPPSEEQALEDTPWEFPGGRLQPKEPPEAGLRRACRETLGVELEIHVGQPPFVHNFGEHIVTYRYYVCGLRGGAPAPRGAWAARWVLPIQLREYVFDDAAQQVVDWLLEKPDNR